MGNSKRIKAVLMYDDGYSNVEIAKVLLLSHEAATESTLTEPLFAA
ncbi:hypothetical protein [Candidatus Tisiphia endosymbiont of Ditula angustiorana]